MVPVLNDLEDLMEEQMETNNNNNESSFSGCRKNNLMQWKMTLYCIIFNFSPNNLRSLCKKKISDDTLKIKFTNEFREKMFSLEAQA